MITDIKTRDGYMKQGILIAGAIVIAGGLIAGALVLGQQGGSRAPVANQDGAQNEQQDVSIRPVDDTDHIRGNPDAKVVIVEYSDFECPFCARFHPTMKRAVEEYNGQVAWVYRHFPLTNIHPEAVPAAEASECVAELGGNDAFWQFADGLFANYESLGDSLYVSLAAEVGVSESELQSCLASDRHLARVQGDFEEAVNAGARGTPFSVLVGEDGQMVPFSGALPYENLQQAIDSLL